jgi:hypothetical protein
MRHVCLFIYLWSVVKVILYFWLPLSTRNSNLEQTLTCVYPLRLERDSIETKSTPVKHTNVAFGQMCKELIMPRGSPSKERRAICKSQVLLSRSYVVNLMMIF